MLLVFIAIDLAAFNVLINRINLILSVSIILLCGSTGKTFRYQAPQYKTQSLGLS